MDELQGPFQSPPKRRWPWVLAVFLVAVVGAAVFAGAYVGAALRSPASNDATEVEVVIAPGMGSTEIGYALAQAGMVKNPWLFVGFVYVSGQGSRLQPGTYRLPKNLTVGQLADRLAQISQSRRRTEIQITIPEGWSNRELAAYLEKQGIATADAFNAVVQHKAAWWDTYDFLASRPADRDLEGYLFPDTYKIYTDATPEDLVRKMLDNFGRKVTPQLRQEIVGQGKTLHEVLTFASIIEREVPDGPDRAKVAGVFAKRLEIGMALQSDATVNYVTGKKESRPSADDLQQESLYNTYIHRGLPPGPINNPGLSAIEAALHPEIGPYLYYLTTPDGTVIYSRTHDEHVRAKARYYP
ncbi:MAG: endolytic transglycosylase MltG [Patescibacteria group bacterium]|nr:endolytic transglycosylase MltG [Patescibacteria group bacterium]